MTSKTKKTSGGFYYWLPIAVVTTIICGLIYTSIQQSFRMGANDPQIQIAEDAAAILSNGVNPQTFIPVNADKVDIAKSLAPYVILYNNNGQPIASTGLLDNQIPNIPSGIFTYVKDHGEDRLTWQPKNGVRSAVVVTQYTGNQSGFVLVGRSLREVEKRENQLLVQVFAAWTVSLVASFVVITFLSLFTPKKNNG